MKKKIKASADATQFLENPLERCARKVMNDNLANTAVDADGLVANNII